MATFNARPKAPGNELLSRTTNVPGVASFSIEIASESIHDVSFLAPLDRNFFKPLYEIDLRD